jgi:hypothetical protein
MSMQAESLEVLEKADVAPAQARAIVRAIEIELAGAKETLATKSDLRELAQVLRQEMRQEMGQLRQETAEMRGELRAEIRASASSTVRQMYGALLGQMAVLLGFTYFFTTHVR